MVAVLVSGDGGRGGSEYRADLCAGYISKHLVSLHIAWHGSGEASEGVNIGLVLASFGVLATARIMPCHVTIGSSNLCWFGHGNPCRAGWYYLPAH